MTGKKEEMRQTLSCEKDEGGDEDQEHDEADDDQDLGPDRQAKERALLAAVVGYDDNRPDSG